MIAPGAPVGVDPEAVAASGLRLTALAPVLVPLPAVAWTGRAARAAAALAEQTRRAELPLREALLAAGQALGVTADALAAAAALTAAAVRIEDATDALSQASQQRLLDDASAQVLAADRACAARLRALLDLPSPLPPLASVTDPEQAAYGWLTAAGWGAVPTALLGPLGALTSRATGADLTAPALARETAAAAVLAAVHPSLLEPETDGTPRTYLLGEAGGHLAEVWGDVSSARTVIVLVPGTQTTARDFGGAQAQGDATYDELYAQGGPDVAVISWLGSPEPPSIEAAVRQSYAKRAAPQLVRFVQSLPTVPDVRLTLVGHSYGAVVAGLAVRGGLRPAALIGVAPAGFGPGVDTAADLGGVPVYAVEDTRDPIRDEYVIQGLLQDVLGSPVDRLVGAAGIGHLGADPDGMPGVVELASGHDCYDPWPVGVDVAIHGEYFEPGSPALRDLVAVAVGGDVRVAPPRRALGRPWPFLWSP